MERQELHGVVLYGSEARGEARPDSDIDVLVLLERPIDYARELRANIAALYDLVLALERPSAPSRWTSTPTRWRRTRCIAVPRRKVMDVRLDRQCRRPVR